MKAAIILSVVFVFTLLLGYSSSAGAEEATLSVGDTNAATYAGEGEGDQAKKEKKGKKDKKNGKKKNGKKKNGKKDKPVEETE